MLDLPVRYCSSASLRSFFSGTTLLLPPAWHAAQLPRKTLSPFSRSAASAGRLDTTAARSPSAAPKASGLQESLWRSPCRSMADGDATAPLAWRDPGDERGTEGVTKHEAPYRAADAASKERVTRAMA